MNKKLKIYLDTSVVSYLLQDDVPEKMEITNRLWELFEEGKYELYLSNVTMKEISKCPEPKSYDDCQHIAAAVECECDCIVSWIFKHIVNIRTIRGVRAITNLKGYKPIEILNPSVLLESEE